MMMVTINNQLISLEILNCYCGNVLERSKTRNTHDSESEGKVAACSELIVSTSKSASVGDFVHVHFQI